MLLELQKINAGYGDLQVLWDVNIAVERGEIVSLLGSNGAGKTTTLRVISGLLRPFSGRVLFNGEDITESPSHRRVEMGLALVPEGRQLFPEMTVLENLEMGAYTRRARERFHETLEWVFSLFPTLKERKSQLAGTMSGGEQQMLAIARGLISRPEVLMMDEPSMGLAPKLVMEILGTVKKLREEGITILLVEQNARAALEVSDRAYILETGRIALQGSSKELLGMDEVRRAYLGI
ncbi:MAG: ABC transporter ATP-binding protein [Candidatus Korarchaeota archaeon NZ13-K]|nr:MAG: ABC transporter ATP-binding protein [Candidatus Korarchaeota archaeon NZ13-K]